MKPFERSYLSEEQYQSMYRKLIRAGLSDESAATEVARAREQVIWRNDEYQVNVVYFTYRPEDESPPAAMAHISIKAVKKGVVRDWRVFQEIKNKILGTECEAIELYPAESRRVDSANQYHLWGFVDPAQRFPIGYREREIDGRAKYEGARQRPFQVGER